MVTKSIIENIELQNGTELYVQISVDDRVTISFDSIANSMQHTMTIAEAVKFADMLNKVVEEAS